MEEKIATTEDEKVEAFCCPVSSNSGCCGSHLITVAKLELKEEMCFCSRVPKSWAWADNFANKLFIKSSKLYLEQL